MSKNYHNGHEISFTRRRYGKAAFFTWIYVRFGNEWQSTGDPLPKQRPSKQDLTDAVNRAHRYRNIEQNEPEKKAA